MQKLLIITLTLLTINTFAQTNLEKKPIERKGFLFGVGLGAGALKLDTNDTTKVAFSTTLPNIKVGFMAGKRLGLFVLLPGANYKYDGKDRGFEAITVAGQYWLLDKWWIMGGTGLTFDAPAFYTVKDPKNAGFYKGFPALTFSTGYEVWHKGQFALDLQYRVFMGKSKLANNGYREGISNMFIIGFNWY